MKRDLIGKGLSHSNVTGNEKSHTNNWECSGSDFCTPEQYLSNKTGNDNEIRSKQTKHDGLTVTRSAKEVEGCSNQEADASFATNPQVKEIGKMIIFESKIVFRIVLKVNNSQRCGFKLNESTDMNFNLSLQRKMRSSQIACRKAQI